MARLRLFANLREAAGTSTVDVAGSTVGEVIRTSTAEFGPAFGAGVESAAVWVNGEPADPDTPVGPDDEVALIPPVSGGQTAMQAPEVYKVGLTGALTAALLISVAASLRVFVFVVVAVALGWLWDLAETARVYRIPLDPYAPLVGAAAGALAAYGFGFGGFAIAVVIGVFAVLVLGLARTRDRSIQSLAATGAATVVAALGTGALVLVRMRTVEEAMGLLVIIAAASIAGWVAGRAGRSVQGMDESLGVLVGAIVTGIVVGIVVERLTLGVSIVGAALVAAGLIGGRTLGTLLRTGAIETDDRPLGALAAMDGAALAAVLFWSALIILG